MTFDSSSLRRSRCFSHRWHLSLYTDECGGRPFDWSFHSLCSRKITVTIICTWREYELLSANCLLAGLPAGAECNMVPINFVLIAWHGDDIWSRQSEHANFWRMVPSKCPNKYKLSLYSRGKHCSTTCDLLPSGFVGRIWIGRKSSGTVNTCLKVQPDVGLSISSQKHGRHECCR